MIYKIKNNQLNFNITCPLIPFDLQLPQSKISDLPNAEISKLDNAISLLSNKHLQELEVETSEKITANLPIATLLNVVNRIFINLWGIPCMRGDAVACRTRFMAKTSISLAGDRIFHQHLSSTKRFFTMILDTFGEGFALHTCISSPENCKKAFFTYHTVRYATIYALSSFTKSFEEVYQDMKENLLPGDFWGLGGAE